MLSADGKDPLGSMAPLPRTYDLQPNGPKQATVVAPDDPPPPLNPLPPMSPLTEPPKSILSGDKPTPPEDTPPASPQSEVPPSPASSQAPSVQPPSGVSAGVANELDDEGKLFDDHSVRTQDITKGSPASMKNTAIETPNQEINLDDL